VEEGHHPRGEVQDPGERDGEDSDAADELAAQSFRRSSYSRPISRSSSFAFGQQNDTPPRVSHS
jgi:hypothetical protein